MTLLRATIRLLAAFLGLCTIFVLIVTVIQAWQEHSHRSWPQATASIQKCDVRLGRGKTRATYDYRGGSAYIVCNLQYEVDREPITSRITSATVRGAGQLNELDAWVGAHPEGTPITVHYDPGDYRKAVLIVTDMPATGPHTPSNIRLLEATAGGCALLVIIAWIMGPLKRPD